MARKDTGLLIVVSGFSGAGKGSIMKKLLQEHKDQYALSISATTRGPRTGETNGKEYFFVDDASFARMIEQEELIEYARYVNHYYGTPKKYVQEQQRLGKDVILEIEIQGALKVKQKYPDTLLLFVTPPSAQELKNRLVGRGTEDAATIQSRMMRAIEEAEGMDAYDYLIVNDDLDECVDQVHEIIQSEHSRISRRRAMVHDIKKELSDFVMSMPKQTTQEP